MNKEKNLINTIELIDDKYPRNLLKINNKPKKLYYNGNSKLLNSKRIIAIVGSRDCSEYGRKYARIFSRELSKNGICIISGMAIGIDTAAHYGALYEKGNTIAVLAGGLDNIYPKENRWLYNAILENSGCIITEHTNEEETIMTDFPKRNRIISGIANAVLVIEAQHRSGSKITAKYAKQQGKIIYCIPNNLDNINGVGTNELILDGAIMVTSPNQIIERLNKQEKVKKETNSIEDKKQIRIVPDNYKNIYELLINKSLTNDEISRQLKINISKVNSILTIMELEGYIEQGIGNKFMIKGD